MPPGNNNHPQSAFHLPPPHHPQHTSSWTQLTCTVSFLLIPILPHLFAHLLRKNWTTTTCTSTDCLQSTDKSPTPILGNQNAVENNNENKSTGRRRRKECTWNLWPNPPSNVALLPRSSTQANHWTDRTFLIPPPTILKNVTPLWASFPPPPPHLISCHWTNSETLQCHSWSVSSSSSVGTTTAVVEQSRWWGNGCRSTCHFHFAGWLNRLKKKKKRRSPNTTINYVPI